MESEHQFTRIPQFAKQYDAAIALLANVKRYPKQFGIRIARALGHIENKEIVLKHCLDCVAVENGFDGWRELWESECQPPADGDLAARWFVEKVMAGHGSERWFDEISEGQEWRNLLSTRLAMLDEGLSVAEIPAGDVNKPMGPLGISPLTYVCCSSFGNSVPELRSRRRRLASELLAAGGNPNDGMLERDSIRGFRTCLGGAVGRARDDQLTALLLNEGADIADGPTLYEGSAMWEAVRWNDCQSLDLLIASEPPHWHLCHAIFHCLQYHDSRMVDTLLAAGADPNWNMTIFGQRGNALHEAIQCDCSAEILEALITAGGKVDSTDEGNRTPMAVATALGREDLCRVLQNHGAKSSEASTWERWVGVNIRRGEHQDLEKEVRSLSESKQLQFHDHLWLHTIVSRGDVQTFDAIEKYLHRKDVIDYVGDTPLHIAIQNNHAELVRRLIEGGAATEVTNFDGETSYDLATRVSTANNQEVFKVIADHILKGGTAPVGDRLKYKDIDAFERSADAIADGDVETLEELLEQFPYFYRARSIRPHRCLLLHYIGVNGFEGERQRTPENAVAVIRLVAKDTLDLNASCYTYRGGPGETVIGLLDSSGVVESPKLKVEMLRELVAHGATISADYLALFDLMDAQEQGTLADKAQLYQQQPAHDQARRMFHLLATLGQVELVEYLVGVGVDVNCVDGLNKTATHVAALNGDSAMVETLVKLGADLSIRENEYGGTPAGWADAGGHDTLSKHLFELEQAQ